MMTADPIERLIEDIAAIRKKVDQLSAKAEPATVEQVRKALEAAKHTPINLDTKVVAQHMLPHLQAGLPTMENLEQMSAAHTQAIAKASQEAADQIYQASQRVPSYIGFSNTIFGCTTWKAFLLWIAVLVVPVAGLSYWVSYERTRAQQAEAKLAETERKFEVADDFARWTVEKYPKVFEAWKKGK